MLVFPLNLFWTVYIKSVVRNAVIYMNSWVDKAMSACPFSFSFKCLLQVVHKSERASLGH